MAILPLRTILGHAGSDSPELRPQWSADDEVRFAIGEYTTNQEASAAAWDRYDREYESKYERDDSPWPIPKKALSLKRRLERPAQAASRARNRAQLRLESLLIARGRPVILDGHVYAMTPDPHDFGELQLVVIDLGQAEKLV